MKKLMNRRDLLKLMSISGAGASTPMDFLFANIVSQFLYQAQAEAAGTLTSRNYVNANLFGGPIRIQFDHWLRTNADDPPMAFNGLAGTAFTYNSSGQATGMEYRTYNYRGYQVPHLFSTFSSADQDAFLDQFLVVRGYGSGMDGHPFNNAIQTLSLAGAPSISGLFMDKSDKSFQGVQFPNRIGGFASQKSLSLNKLGSTGNPLNTLLQPIIKKASQNYSRDLRDRYSSTISAMRAQLRNIAADSKAGTIASQTMSDAYSMFNRGAPDITSWWTMNVASYTSVMEAAMRESAIPGITARHDNSGAISVVSDGSSKYRLSGLKGDWTFAVGVDLAQCRANMTLANFAEGLALAEYVLTNNLSTVAEIDIGSFDGVWQTPTAGAAQSIPQNKDQHTTGAYPIVLYQSLVFRGVIAALLRFKTQLQVAGKWDQTIVQITGDFGRTLRATEDGSDHGFNQMVSSIFSGVIKGGPYVVGNISTKGQNNLNVTQGYGVPIPGYNQKGIPSPIALTSTVYGLTDVDRNPWQNLAAPLVTLNTDGTLLLPYGKGKLVSGA